MNLLCVGYFFPTQRLFSAQRLGRLGSVIPCTNSWKPGPVSHLHQWNSHQPCPSLVPLQWEHALSPNPFHVQSGFPTILFPFSKDLSTEVDQSLAVILNLLIKQEYWHVPFSQKSQKTFVFNPPWEELTFFPMKIFSFVLIANHFAKGDYYCTQCKRLERVVYCGRHVG